jgi:predicted DNA-binding transcriptional regulator AlpA
MATPSPQIDGRFLPAADVMKALGYTDASGFYRFVKRTGLPFVKLSRRTMVFERSQFEAWVKRRTVVGTVVGRAA